MAREITQQITGTVIGGCNRSEQLGVESQAFVNGWTYKSEATKNKSDLSEHISKFVMVFLKRTFRKIQRNGSQQSPMEYSPLYFMKNFFVNTKKHKIAPSCDSYLNILCILL